ncbi:MAG: IS200/IS605 family transposase [Pirellulaceae bacterium]
MGKYKKWSPEGAIQAMPQSHARIHIHLIFSTKHRERFISDMVRDPLHKYMGTILKDLGCAPVLINSVEDHIHLLFDLGRMTTVSGAVKGVKETSSQWIKQFGAEFQQFAWQAGYGAFAVSQSKVESVRRYIANQQEHHRHKSFQEEFRRFLERHKVEYDEQYVWD